MKVKNVRVKVVGPGGVWLATNKNYKQCAESVHLQWFTVATKDMSCFGLFIFQCTKNDKEMKIAGRVGPHCFYTFAQMYTDNALTCWERAKLKSLYIMYIST